MAVDETLLHSTRAAILRFYRWSEPSVSFGYFDSFEEARRFAAGRALVRRWTGGGIVPHGADLTYSLIVPSSEAACRLSSPALYREIHLIIADVLRRCGMHTQLADDSAPRMSAVCFANPVLADVLEGERKIAGAAHRKTRRGLLHQGSIQRDDLPNSFRTYLAAALSNTTDQEQLERATFRAAERLAKEKYSTEAWLRRR